MSSASDAIRCPLCGNDNDCGMAKGQGLCWCFSEKISSEVLKKVPVAAQGLVCVCRACSASKVPTPPSGD